VVKETGEGSRKGELSNRSSSRSRGGISISKKKNCISQSMERNKPRIAIMVKQHQYLNLRRIVPKKYILSEKVRNAQVPGLKIIMVGNLRDNKGRAEQTNDVKGEKFFAKDRPGRGC